MSLLASTMATHPGDLLLRLGEVFYFVVLPLLLLAGIGFANQVKLKLDLRTLTKLNFNLVVPGIIYASLVTSKVTVGDVAQVVIFAFGMMACMSAVTYVVARLRRLSPDVRNVMLMTTIFHNSGNYALPLQDLAFRASGFSAMAASLQAFYMITQNVTNFTFGVVLAASGRKDRHWRDNLVQIAKFPPIYALAAALVTIQIRSALGDHACAVGDALLPFWKAIDYIRGAFVTVALFTLGAQMAAIGRDSTKYPVKAGIVLRLLVGPIIGLGLVYLLDLHGLVAQVMLIGTSTPTAVNTLLLCMEFDNHPDFAARAVLYSTIISPLTVTAVIFLAQGGFLPQLAM